MIMALSGYESPMLPKHLFEGTDIRANTHANHPIGTGPYKFVEWQRGQYMRFDRNPDYWKKGEPYLERIVARFIADYSTRSAVIETGDAHIAGFGAVPYSDVNRLKELPDIDVTLKGYEKIGRAHV